MWTCPGSPSSKYELWRSWPTQQNIPGTYEPHPRFSSTNSRGYITTVPLFQESYTVSVSLMPTPNNKKLVDCWYSLILPEEEVRLVRFRERDFLRGREGWKKQMSNERKGPWLFKECRGWNNIQLYGEFNIIIIKIPIKQPGFNGKYPSFFFVVSNVVCYVHPEHWGR